jgi:periplasmic protein CpxP/Spy
VVNNFRLEKIGTFVGVLSFSGLGSHRTQNATRRDRRNLFEDTAMTPFSRPVTMPTPFRRSLAIVALLGATMLAGPLTAACAGADGNATFQLAEATAPQTQAGAGATSSNGETIEQRITTLHAALKITPDEETKWNDVAQTMRENAAAMDKLVAASRTTPPQNMTAVEDLQLYQKFAQTHVDGLNKLIPSVTALYSSMPDAQKKIADKVFQSAHQTAAAHS